MNVNVLEDAGPQSIKWPWQSTAHVVKRSCAAQRKRLIKERPVAHLQEQSVNVEAWREVMNYDAEEYEQKLCRSYRKRQKRKERENAHGLMRYSA